MKLKSLIFLLVIIFSLPVKAQVSFVHDFEQGSCFPADINFENTSTVGNYYEWIFNELDTVYEKNTSYFVKQGTELQVILNAYDTTGGNNFLMGNYNETISSINSEVIIAEKACPNQLLEFVVDNWETENMFWELGDGNVQIGSYIVYQYNEEGTYNVEVTFETEQCGVENYEQNIVIKSENYSFEDVDLEIDRVACPGESTSFDLYIDENNTEKVVFDYGDGSLDTSFFPVDYTYYHAYQTAGNYEVKSTIYASCGNDTTITIPVEIREDIAVDYYLNYDESVCPNQEAFFRVSGIAKGSKVNWVFGNGAAASGESATVTYSQVGEYNGYVKVTNSCGNTLTKDFTVDVIQDIPFLGNADISFPDTICINEKAPFLAYLHRADSVIWNVNDEIIETKEMIDSDRYYEFETEGEKQIEITFVNGCGNKLTIDTTVFVGEAPGYKDGDLYLYPLNEMSMECLGDTVSYILYPNRRGLPSDIHSFSFGDGNSTNEFIEVFYESTYNVFNFYLFKHVYETSGSYRPVVKYITGCGELDSLEAENYLIITENAKGYIEYNISDFNNDGLNLVNETLFLSNYIGGSLKIELGDGREIISSDPLIAFSYPQSGVYDVKVSSINSCGYTSKYVTTLKVEGFESVTENQLKNIEDNIFVSPNPASNLLQFYTKSNKANWKLFDSSGRMIWEQKAKQQGNIDVSKFIPGLYFLQAESNGEFEIEKVVIK